jgi:hypothetical protein
MGGIVNAACEGGVTQLWRRADENDGIQQDRRTVIELLRKRGSIGS